MDIDRPQKVEMVPISRITVLNPRARNKRQHREIVNNIETIGLKRPITVSRKEGPNGPVYDLVCGEGRLEAFLQLGQTEIPAVVIEVSETDCLVMSLVENIARRLHRPIDIMREVGELKKRGYSDAEISQKIGVATSWVGKVVNLLNRGEDRLVSAVDTGLIPISLAMEIAQAETEEAQQILLDAYEAGEIRGKKLSAIRRLLDLRMQRKRKGLPSGRFGRQGGRKRITPQDLMQVYQREADKQRLIVKKSDYTQTRLLFIVEAMKDLLATDGFLNLLRAESLNSMPRALALRIEGRTDE